jgi:hypothetical protein
VIHVKEIEKALDKLIRVLAPNGRLALYVTNSTAAQLLPHKLKRYFLSEEAININLEKAFNFNGIRNKLALAHPFNVLIDYLEHRGLRLPNRHCAEFTDYSLQFSGNWFSRLIWQINTIWFRYHLPPSISLTNLLIFEKSA